MMRVKPLQTLLDQAAEFCKNTATGQVLEKTASASESEASALAGLLAGAETDITIQYDPEALKQAEIDKIAESLNRVQTASEIDTVLQLAQFEKRAREEGFTNEQINEAFSKIAAEKIAKNVPLLAAMGFVGFSGDDKNMRSKKPENKKSQAQLLGRLGLAKSVGY